MTKPKKLLDQVRELLRTKHYSIRTEESYVSWIPRVNGCVGTAMISSPTRLLEENYSEECHISQG